MGSLGADADPPGVGPGDCGVRGVTSTGCVVNIIAPVKVAKQAHLSVVTWLRHLFTEDNCCIKPMWSLGMVLEMPHGDTCSAQ